VFGTEKFKLPFSYLMPHQLNGVFYFYFFFFSLKKIKNSSGVAMMYLLNLVETTEDIFTL
jgi:hypothetical protein